MFWIRCFKGCPSNAANRQQSGPTNQCASSKAVCFEEHVGFRGFLPPKNDETEDFWTHFTSKPPAPWSSCLLCSYLSPGSGHPLQPLVLWAAPQDTGLLGFGPVVLSAHAVGHHRRLGPQNAAAAKHAPLPQSAAAGLGALWEDVDGVKGVTHKNKRACPQEGSDSIIKG